MSKKKEKKTYRPTTLQGGPDRIIEICEKLRVLNTDGYIRKSLWLADVKPFGFRKRVTKATVCSPFTGTVMGMAFDPDYATKDPGTDSYEPHCDQGDEILPYDFYKLQNGGQAPKAFEKYGIGEKVHFKQMRRGDLVGIDWVGGGGHLVFCWDVHLNGSDVDCFQIIGSHGSLKGNGAGVHIHGCSGSRWLLGKPAKYDKPGTGNMSKAKDPIFVDEDEIVRQGTWFAVPGVQDRSIDRTTFRVEPLHVAAPGGKYRGPRVNHLFACRFHYDGDPPKPLCMQGVAQAPPQPETKERGHVVVPVTPVPKAEIKKDPEKAKKKVEAKPVVQHKKKPLMMQKDVEMAMQDFYTARWIQSDPGIPDDINDDRSKAAIKDFQRLFGLDDDGIVGKKTFGAIKKQLPAVHLQALAEDRIVRLFQGGELKHDPGSPNGVNDGESAAAFKEFQASVGLRETGVPDAETQEKLKKAVDDLAASAAKPGLNPQLEALYWLGNHAPAGGQAKLRLHSHDLKTGASLKIELESGGKKVESKAKLVVNAERVEAEVPVPKEFGSGSVIVARVEAEGRGEKLRIETEAPLYVRGEAQARTYRKFRITTYHIAGQPDASPDETVPVYDKSKNVLTHVTPAFFAEMSLEGTGKLRDERLINVAGANVAVNHDDYAGVKAYHEKYLRKHDGTMRPYGYSGLVVKNDRVVQASAFHVVSDEKLGKGFGTQRGVAYEPFRTLAADIGHYKNSDPKYRDKGGLVPAGTRVHIRHYEGKTCPDGQGGTFVHDGWFTVNDTGGGIFGAHFDVFVGTKELGKQVPHKGQMEIWFEGIEERVAADYDLGLNG